MCVMAVSVVSAHFSGACYPPPTHTHAPVICYNLPSFFTLNALAFVGNIVKDLIQFAVHEKGCKDNCTALLLFFDHHETDV